MRSLEMTSGDLETTSSLALGNECGRIARLQQLLEVVAAAATAGSCGGLPARPEI